MPVEAETKPKAMRKWRPQWMSDYYKSPANRARTPSFPLWKWAFDCKSGKPRLAQQRFRPVIGASSDTARPDRYVLIEDSVKYEKQMIPLTWEQVLWLVEQGRDMKTPIKNLVGKLVVENKISAQDLTPRQKSALAKAPEVFVYAMGPSTVGDGLVEDLSAEDPERDAFFAALQEKPKPATAAAPKPVQAPVKG